VGILWGIPLMIFKKGGFDYRIDNVYNVYN